MEPGEIAAGESFSAISASACQRPSFCSGRRSFLFSLLLAARSEHIRRLLLLSATIFAGGAVAMLYTYTQATALLSAPFWFPVLLLAELALMILAYTTILACTGKAFKNAAVWIPVLIFCAVIPLFATAWAVRAAAAIMTAARSSSR